MNHELTLLLYVIAALLIFGVPAIMRKTVLPFEPKLETLDPGQLPEMQRNALGEYDRKLEKLGYRPFATYRVGNFMGANLNRTYVNSADPARCTVSFVRDAKGRVNTSIVEFITFYADGTMLSTRNMEHKALLDPLPGSTVQECRAIREPAELKRKHDAKSAELNVHGVKYFEPDTFFDEYRRKYDEFCRHQQSRNLLRPDPRAGVYRATHWTALRGVRNYLNPFADQFTWSRFAIGTLLGAGLPTMAILQPQAVTHQVSTLLSLSMDQSWMAVVVASYLVAGATVGYLFTGKSFVWAFLLGAVPARVAGSTLGPLYGLLMAWTADVAGRYRNRRAKVI